MSYVFIIIVIVVGLYSQLISGQTWVVTKQSPPNFVWNSVAMSNSGVILYVLGYSSSSSTANVYRSSNSGGSWSKINENDNQYWSIACDSTGSRAVVGANNQGMWSNWGGTFLLNYQNSNIGTVYQVVMDSTGQYVVALSCKLTCDFFRSHF